MSSELEQQYKNQQFANGYELVNGVKMAAANPVFGGNWFSALATIRISAGDLN